MPLPLPLSHYCYRRYDSDMLGTDEDAVLTWPVLVVSRLLPALLVASGVTVPAVFWSRLPPSRPGPLGWSIAIGGLGLIRLVPQIRHPVVNDPEVFEEAWYLGLWVRARFGRLATGNFTLSFATALAVGLTVTNVHLTAWHVGLGTVLTAGACSLVPGVSSGVILRRYGRSYRAKRVIEARSRPAGRIAIRP